MKNEKSIIFARKKQRSFFCMSKSIFTILYVCLILQQIVTTGCNSKSDVFLSLEQTDSLLSADNDSLAAEIFYQLTMPEDSTEDLAYYNYISARINCRHYEFQEPSTLDFPIEFFKAQGDNQKLAYAYSYKTYFLLTMSDLTSAQIYNSWAEDAAKDIDDDILKYNIFSNGYTISSANFDTDECLLYAEKAYRIGEKLHDNERIAYPAMYLTMCYNEKNMPDSAQKYMSVCLNLLECYNMGAKAAVFNSFGDAMLKKQNLDFAEHYYLESVAIIDNPDAYNGLTRIYLLKGEADKAKESYAKALRKAAHEADISLMEVYAEHLQKAGEAAAALDIYRQISVERDSLQVIKMKNLATQKENIYSVYRRQKLDNEVLTHKIFVQRIWIYVLLAAVVLLLFYVLTSKKRGTKTVSKAEVLYEAVVRGENISQWTKNERELFAEYYLNKNQDFKKKIEENYEKLPVNSVLLLILQDLGKNKTEILEIMGFSDQAFRSLKSRTEKMMKNITSTV